MSNVISLLAFVRFMWGCILLTRPTPSPAKKPIDKLLMDRFDVFSDGPGQEAGPQLAQELNRLLRLFARKIRIAFCIHLLLPGWPDDFFEEKIAQFFGKINAQL
jgi:hypothetical protein